MKSTLSIVDGSKIIEIGAINEVQYSQNLESRPSHMEPKWEIFMDSPLKVGDEAIKRAKRFRVITQDEKEIDLDLTVKSVTEYENGIILLFN
jgi:hypothetical protein